VREGEGSHLPVPGMGQQTQIHDTDTKSVHTAAQTGQKLGKYHSERSYYILTYIVHKYVEEVVVIRR
jgi:hypothetical protein